MLTQIGLVIAFIYGLFEKKLRDAYLQKVYE